MEADLVVIPHEDVRSTTKTKAPPKQRTLPAQIDLGEAAVPGGAADTDTAARLSKWSSLQASCTALPLIGVDFLVLWVLLLFSSAAVERLLHYPINLITHRTALLASLILIPVAELAGVYPGIGMNPVVEFRQLVRSAGIALMVFAGVGLLCVPDRWLLFLLSSSIAFLACIPLLPAFRFAARSLSARLPFWGARVLIHAGPDEGRDVFRRLAATPDRGLRPVGVLLSPDDYWTSAERLEDEGIPTYNIGDAENVALANRATWLLIGTRDSDPRREAPLAASPEVVPNRVLLSSSQFDLGIWDDTCTIGTTCGLRYGSVRPHAAKRFLKRAIDLAVGLLILLVSFPFILAACIAIRLSSPGPVFYGQNRVGRHGRMFKAWKFRTMMQNADEVLEECLRNDPALRREWVETHKLKRDPRITRIGRFLRSTSLDELPQLWNIVCGEMSLVGPRPIVDSPTYDRIYVADYPTEFAAYCSVSPGLTGLWQVTCRNNGIYEMRVYWDMQYIRNWSLWLDVYIILRTVRTVLLREGAY